jgi:L-amino acid N-acyltransferase YncA
MINPKERKGKEDNARYTTRVTLGIQWQIVSCIGIANAHGFALFASLGFQLARTVALFDKIEIWVVNACVIEADQWDTYESVPHE